MTALPSTMSESPTIEQEVNSMIEDVKAKACGTYEACEAKVKQSPTKAVLIAVGTGYCLHRLPVRALLVSQVRLLAALAPPVLFVLGAAKLCGFLQKQARR